MRKKNRNKNNGQQWQVSFSDLLTLLLCFFVALISFGNFKKIETGTAFADTNIVSDKFKKKILLSEAELKANMLSKKFSELKSTIKSDTFKLTGLNLETCGLLGRDEWQNSIDNMGELDSQISDAFKEDIKITYRLLGKNCESLSKDKKKVAKLNAVFNKIK